MKKDRNLLVNQQKKLRNRSIDFKFILALFVRAKNSLGDQEIVSSVTGHRAIVEKLLIRFLFCFTCVKAI